jgi:hypothetical protein
MKKYSIISIIGDLLIIVAAILNIGHIAPYNKYAYVMFGVGAILVLGSWAWKKTQVRNQTQSH